MLTRTLRCLLAAAAIALACLAFASPARAATVRVYCPFYDAASGSGGFGFIGTDQWGTWVGWVPYSTLDCSKVVWHRIGETHGLTSNVDVYGSPGNDWIVELGVPNYLCDAMLAPPLHNGYFLTIRGGTGGNNLAGNDYTMLVGGASIDHLTTGAYGGVLLFGYAGNDTFYSEMGGNDSELYWGGTGTDYVYDASGSYLAAYEIP